METESLLAVLSLAFGLGLIHALDADHIVAVYGLASTQPGFRQSFSFCIRWSTGHGLTILALGTAAVLTGQAIPESLSKTAENFVGLVLIGIGLWVLKDLRRNRLHLHFHKHEGVPMHAHWHTHKEKEHHKHGHGATMVGALHGMAGSAPLLALVPLTSNSSPWGTITYLMIFGLGVLIAMLIFGGVMGIIFRYAIQRSETLVNFIRGGVAFISIGFGVFLLNNAF